MVEYSTTSYNIVGLWSGLSQEPLRVDCGSSVVSSHFNVLVDVFLGTRRAGALVRAFSGNAYAYPPDQRRRVHNQLQLSSRMPAS